MMMMEQEEEEKNREISIPATHDAYPSPAYPGLHRHENEPGSFVQSASA